MGRVLVDDIKAVLKFNHPVSVERLPDKLVFCFSLTVKKLFFKQVHLLSGSAVFPRLRTVRFPDMTAVLLSVFLLTVCRLRIHYCLTYPVSLDIRPEYGTSVMHFCGGLLFMVRADSLFHLLHKVFHVLLPRLISCRHLFPYRGFPSRPVGYRLQLCRTCLFQRLLHIRGLTRSGSLRLRRLWNLYMGNELLRVESPVNRLIYRIIDILLVIKP